MISRVLAMRAFRLFFISLFLVASFAARAQDAGIIASSPFNIDRLSEGMVFRGHVTLDSGEYKESLLAIGACVIAKGKYIPTPRNEDAILSAGEQSRHVFDDNGDEGAKLVGKLIDQEDKKAGDAHCLIQRRVETGCAFGTCVTARQFDVYLFSYDKSARSLGTATDVCGGSVLRGVGECLPTITGGGSAISGLALCVETQADLKSGGKQPSSLVFAYGIVPKQVASQAVSGASRQNTGCAARGLAGQAVAQGAPVAAPIGSAPAATEAGAEESTIARRSRWRLRLPRLPRQPKTSVTDEFSD